MEPKLKLKRLSAHQFRRTWAMNFRRSGVGDLFDLQLEGGWEDLNVPQRFYVDVEAAKAGRTSSWIAGSWSAASGSAGRRPPRSA